MRVRLIVLVPWIFVALSLRAAEPAAVTDPISWTAPQKAPLFVERIPIAAYSSRIAKARERAKELTLERAALPAHGLIVNRASSLGQAGKAGIETGDIFLTIDGKPLVDGNDISKFRANKAQTLTYFSRKRGLQTLDVQPGTIGINVKAFDRENPLMLEGKLDDPRWADELHIAGLIDAEDPELAETALARVVSSGFPRSGPLELAAARLAVNTGHYEQAMGIAKQALVAPRPMDVRPLNQLFFVAALSCYKLEAALELARKSPDPELSRSIPDLERLVAAHKALPAAVRLAPAPSELAATLFYDDLTLRTAQPPPTIELEADQAEVWKKIHEQWLIDLCAFKPVGFKVPSGHFDTFNIIPTAKNMYFTCKFIAAPADNTPNKYVWNLLFSFVKSKPPVDGQPSDGIGLQFFPQRFSPVAVVHPDKAFEIDAEPIPYDANLKTEHKIELYAIGGRFEALLDGKRFVYMPLDLSDEPMCVQFGYSGVNGELRDFSYCELLTPEERKDRVDPEIGKAYRFGWTRLHRMVQWAPTDAIAALLKIGANPNQTDDDSRTPLMLAVSSNRLDVVKLLLEKGAKPELADKKGKNVYDLAMALGYKEIANYLLKLNPDLGKGMKAVKPPKPPDNDF